MEMVTLKLDISAAAAKKFAKIAGVDFADWQDGGEGDEKMNKVARRFLVDGLKNAATKTAKKKRS